MESFPEEIQEIIKKNEDPERRIRSKEEKEMATNKIASFIKSNNDQFVNLLVQLLNKSSYSSSQLYNNIIQKIVIENPSLKPVFIDFIMNFKNDDLYQPNTCIEALESYFSLLAAYVPIYRAKTEGSLTFEEICQYLHDKELTPLNLCLLLHYKKYIKKVDEKLYSIIGEEEKKAEEIASSLRSSYFIPDVTNNDSEDPHISKFGGKCPYLPSEGKFICKEEGCGKEADLIFSLAVESLPNEIQQYFPEDQRTCVIVGTFCQDCGKALPIAKFTKEQISQLQYADIPNPENPFNEPRTITGWRKGKMTPKSIETLDSSFKDLSAPLDFYFVKSKLQKYSNPESLTYIGGYPDGEPQNTIKPSKLLLQMGESKESTNNWGGYGTAQVWMTTGEKFGEFEFALSIE